MNAAPRDEPMPEWDDEPNQFSGDSRTTRRTVMRLLLLFLCSVGLAGCGQAQRGIDTTWHAVTDDSYRLVVATGKHDGKLVFVAITGDLKESKTITPSIVSGEGIRGADRNLLNRPDGAKEILPNGVQLFEYIDGRWSEAKADITIAEMESFMESEPAEFSINSLLEFVKSRRHN